MSENGENQQGNAQENQNNSENNQNNSEINTEIENNSTEITSEDTPEHAKDENVSDDDNELPIPEPDIIEDESKKKKEPPEWLKKKIERERSAAERKEAEAAILREENERLKAGIQPPKTPQNVPGPQGIDPYMPQRDQFSNESEYFLALSDYREQRKQQEYMFQKRNEAIKKHEEEFQGKLKSAIETGKTKYKDFDERTDYILYGDGFPSNRAMAEAIVDSDYKDDILYFLGTHVKEAERIANLNPVSAAKEIAKIEVRLGAKRKSNIPKAPPPLKPLGSGNKGSATHGDPNKMGMDDFRQWYKDKYG